MRKWLKWIGIGIAALVGIPILVLLGAGFRSDAGVTDAAVYVDRPPEDVFAWLNDGDNALRWVSGLVALEPLDEGPLRPGYRQNAVVEMDGERFTLLMECTALREGEAIEWHVSLPAESGLGFDEDVIQEVVPEGDGARFHTRAVTEYHGLLGNLLEPLITSSTQEKMEGDVQRFRELAEAEIPPGGAAMMAADGDRSAQ